MKYLFLLIALSTFAYADTGKYGHAIYCLHQLYEKLGFRQDGVWPSVFNEELTFIPFSGNDFPSWKETELKYRNADSSPLRDQALSTYFFLFNDQSVKSLRFPSIHGNEVGSVIRYKIDGKIYYGIFNDIFVTDFVDEKGKYPLETYQKHRKYIKNHPEAVKDGAEYYFEALPITDDEMLKAAESSLKHDVATNVKSFLQKITRKLNDAVTQASESKEIVSEPDLSEESLAFECSRGVDELTTLIEQYKRDKTRSLDQIRSWNEYRSNKKPD